MKKIVPQPIRSENPFLDTAIRRIREALLDIYSVLQGNEDELSSLSSLTENLVVSEGGGSGSTALTAGSNIVIASNKTSTTIAVSDSVNDDVECFAYFMS